MALERNSNGAMTTEADTKNDTDSFFDSIPGMTEEVGPARPDQSELYKKDRIQRRNTTRPQKRQGSSGESKKETTNAAPKEEKPSFMKQMKGFFSSLLI
ncbi:hypothetical protein WA577_000629 [Blastocystis sp. JDR]